MDNKDVEKMPYDLEHLTKEDVNEFYNIIESFFSKRLQGKAVQFSFVLGICNPSSNVIEEFYHWSNMDEFSGVIDNLKNSLAVLEKIKCTVGEFIITPAGLETTCAAVKLIKPS